MASSPRKVKKLSESHKQHIAEGLARAKERGVVIGRHGPLTEEGRKNVVAASQRRINARKLTGGMPLEQRQKTSETMTGRIYPPERGAARAAAFTPEERARLAKNTFDGGTVAEDFAAVLCPAGFIREYPLWFGNKINKDGRRTGSCRMDFAHLEGKIDIEDRW